MNLRITNIVTSSEDTFEKFAIFKPKENIVMTNYYPSSSDIWSDEVPVTKSLFRNPNISQLSLIKNHIYLIASHELDDSYGWETYYIADMTLENLVWFTTATAEKEIADEYHQISDEAIKREEEFSKFLTDNSIQLVNRNDILLALLNGVRF